MKILKVICYMNGFFESVEILPTMDAVQHFLKEKSAFDVKEKNGAVESFSYREDTDLFECYVSESTLDLGLKIVTTNGIFQTIESPYEICFSVEENAAKDAFTLAYEQAGFVKGTNGSLLLEDAVIGALIYRDFHYEKESAPWEIIKSNDTSLIRKQDGFKTVEDAFESYLKQVEKIK